MNFKLSVLSLATAGALAVAGQASAFAPAWPADGDAANGVDPAGNAVIWHSGATASTSSLQTAVVQAFCDTAQPVDILEDARAYTVAPNPAGATDILKAGVAKPDFWSVACIGKGTLPATLAGKKVLWSKRDEGGSGTGVGPLATSKFIGFMKPSTGFTGAVFNNCPGNNANGDGVTRNYPRTVAGVSTTVWNCTHFNVPATFSEAAPDSDGVSRVSDIGTSDIEPDKFTTAFNFNVPASDFDLDGVRGPTDTDDILAPHDATGLVKEGVAQLIFNTPVNILMYQDLQRAQFPTGHPLNNDCHPDGAGYGLITSSSANANKEKCMPSLMANEVRSILAKGGAIRSTKDFQAETTYGSGLYGELDATITSGTTDNTIQICRRVNGSGTQAQANAMILGYPCDATNDAAIDTLLPEAESALTLFVTENESSGDVEKCLNDYNNGTNTNANATNKNTLLRKRWAIGVQSLEKNNTLSNAYRFIKIDGYAPTLVNAHAGDYFDIGQQSLQYKAGAPTVTVDVFTALKPFIQDPLKLPALNKLQPFGTSGWLATPSATVLPDSKLDLGRPVAWFRRVSSTNVANTCAFPSAFKKSGIPGTDITVGPQGCSAGENTDGDQNCYTP